MQQNGKSSMHNMLKIDSDSQIEPFRELTRRIHKYGTPVFLQIAHCGRQTRSKITGFPTVAPCAIKDNRYNEEIPHALLENEINEIIHNFVLAIERAKKQDLTACSSMLLMAICFLLFYPSHE